jgi:hypothetical protein
MIVEVKNIKQAFRNVRNDLANRIWAKEGANPLNGRTFFVTLGEENNMAVKIDINKTITELEFKNESDYTMFMLRWS